MLIRFVIRSNLPDAGPVASSEEWSKKSVVLEGILMKKRKKSFLGQRVMQKRYFILAVEEHECALHYFTSTSEILSGKPPNGKESLF
jgi:hypothetical protein